MPRSVQALVRPELLAWGREDAGYTLEQAAKKVPVPPERLAAWEKGEGRPTIVQLRKLAKAYRRPLAVFFLSQPPKKFQAMHDFRRLPGEVAGHESPNLRFAITRVLHRRQIALELFELLGVEPPPFEQSATLEEAPEALASRVRKWLDISTERQEQWRDKYEALNAWRGALEEKGVLVFQVTDVELAEMRGFSISDTPLPAIAVNIKDAVSGRIFTILHELAHLMLRESGLCDLVERALRSPADQNVEVFCNHVAGAVLVPMTSLLADRTVQEHGRRPDWSDFEMKVLARKYWVSREVMLRRLLIAGRTTQSFYEATLRQYQREYDVSTKSEGFAPPHLVALSSAGTLFTRLVLDNYYRENITSSDVAEYLDVRLKHMPKIEEALLKRAGASGEPL